MSYTEDEYNRAKSKMLGDFHKAITDAEALRQAAPEVSGDGSSAAPATFEEALEGATASLAGAPQAAVVTTGEAAGAAGDCERDRP